jgi:type II secretory pathway component GspD/PulD (secretin)
MTRRWTMTAAVVLILAVVTCGSIVADDAATVVGSDVKCVTPAHSDACYLASRMWGQTYPQMELRHYYPHFSTNLIKQAIDALPGYDGRRVDGMCAWSYTYDREPAAVPMPMGLAGEPEVVVCDNCIKVVGTPAAVNAAAAAIKLLDIPRLSVALHVVVVDWPAPKVELWCRNWSALPPDAYAKSLPATRDTKPPYRYGIDVQHAALAALENKRGLHTLETNVNIVNGAQGIIAIGEAIPIGIEHECCQFAGPNCGRPECTMAIFRGIELWVKPQIMADGTIDMILRPRLTDWAGTICGDEHYPTPITRYQSTRGNVLVTPGQSLVITSLLRDNYVLNHTIAGTVREYRNKLMHNPTIIITPTVVRPPAQ